MWDLIFFLLLSFFSATKHRKWPNSIYSATFLNSSINQKKGKREMVGILHGYLWSQRIESFPNIFTCSKEWRKTKEKKTTPNLKLRRLPKKKRRKEITGLLDWTFNKTWKSRSREVPAIPAATKQTEYTKDMTDPIENASFLCNQTEEINQPPHHFPPTGQ